MHILTVNNYISILITYMFNFIYLIHAVSQPCDTKSFITHVCDTIFDVGTTFLCFASFLCDFQQYAEVPRKTLTTDINMSPTNLLELAETLCDN